MPARIADPDLLKLYSFGLFTQLSGAVTAGMIHLGDKLGLFSALAAADHPVTAGELADVDRSRRTLDPRVGLQPGRGQDHLRRGDRRHGRPGS